MQALGLGRVGVRQRSVAQLAVGVFAQRDARPRRVEQERIAAGGAHHRVVADQRPVSAGHGAVLLVEPVAHLDAVGDAVAIGDHQRWPVVGLRLAERLQRLLGIGAHRDAGDVHAAVGDRLQGEVLLGHRLAGGGELGDGAERRRLGHLPAGVGVHLGVEHQHVHVAPAGQHVIEAAGPDVVGPAVAADDPHAAADEVIHDAEQVGHGGAVEPVEPVHRARPRARAAPQLGLAELRSVQDPVDQLRPQRVAQPGEPPARQRGVRSAASRKPRPNSALSSKSEFDHAGPRPSASIVHGVVGRFPP